MSFTNKITKNWEQIFKWICALTIDKSQMYLSLLFSDSFCYGKTIQQSLWSNGHRRSDSKAMPCLATMHARRVCCNNRFSALHFTSLQTKPSLYKYIFLGYCCCYFSPTLYYKNVEISHSLNLSQIFNTSLSLSGNKVELRKNGAISVLCSSGTVNCSH